LQQRKNKIASHSLQSITRSPGKKLFLTWLNHSPSSESQAEAPERWLNNSSQVHVMSHMLFSQL
jgi:hypothetical protein